tara:strand:+ start:250 stop:405 length:156 start_codon:yes stop_codon:yes gene_type:complete
MNERDEALRDALKKSEEAAQNTFESWIVDLEDKDQPEACSIDNEDCEACGS